MKKVVFQLFLQKYLGREKEFVLSGYMSGNELLTGGTGNTIYHKVVDSGLS